MIHRRGYSPLFAIQYLQKGPRMNLRRFFSLSLLGLFAAAFSNTTLALESDELPADFLTNSKLKSMKGAPHTHFDGQAHARKGIPYIDSVVNWNDHYFADGSDSTGNPNREWYTNTVGNPPQHRGATLINAPIVPMIMDLRNFDGSPRYVNGHRLISSAEPFVQRVLDSPVFAYTNWSSSPVPTQFTDAIQRAQYYSQAKDDWHTWLVPSVKTARTMTLIRGTYRFALNVDGSCCMDILVDEDAFINAWFPQLVAYDPNTTIGAAEIAGDITTKDISTFLFPNTFLYEGGDPSVFCCVGGWHGYDIEPADSGQETIEKRYVINFSSWGSPGVFGDDVGSDIASLSHEIAEIFNDPFVPAPPPYEPDVTYNVTPWWLAPNGLCINIREVADVIEGLPNELYPVTINGYTYHPVNVALSQWFQREVPSSALHSSYSYPEETVLNNLSDPQRAYCQ